ncbi:mercury resistance system periplasmic binding protein MerP [Noviherbaspirillum sp. ST9]|uniref:mercury resistance system periplasmic binding protein MerP n=1 Tax=Noviherbaspirillum sp. ST9 TaxID=3401606 RepID=UPI003B5869CD
MKRLALLATLAAFSSPLWAASQTVTLSVPGMDCAACPITIKKALMKVSGVSKAEVSFEKRQAIVTFDDTQTDVGSLTQATINVGYPSEKVAS